MVCSIVYHRLKRKHCCHKFDAVYSRLQCKHQINGLTKADHRTQLLFSLRNIMTVYRALSPYSAIAKNILYLSLFTLSAHTLIFMLTLSCSLTLKLTLSFSPTHTKTLTLTLSYSHTFWWSFITQRMIVTNVMQVCQFEA